MRIVHFEKGDLLGIAADGGSGWHGLIKHESGFPGTLPELIAQARCRSSAHGQRPSAHARNRHERSSDTASGAQAAAEDPLCRSQLR